VSSEDVEILRRALDAGSEGDLAAWFQVAHPDIRVYPRPGEPDADKEYRGLDGLMDYAVNWYSQWDEYDFEAVDITDAGEHVLVVLRERGRIQRTGMEVVEELSHSFVMRDGKVAEWHMYDSHEEARAAVGLS
jgi:ketosteroid isomerase-like protein